METAAEVPRRSGHPHVTRITRDIRDGLQRQEGVIAISEFLKDLDRGAFLALLPRWPELIACSWLTGGKDAIDGLNQLLVATLQALEPPEDLAEQLASATVTGLRLAWTQALAEVLAVRGKEPWTTATRPDEGLLRSATGLSLRSLSGRGLRMRRRRFVRAEFVSVPLAEFSGWSRSLFGEHARDRIMQWLDHAAHPDDFTTGLTEAKRFVGLHDVCIARHLWLASDGADWLTAAFSLWRSQPLIDTEMASNLEQHARTAILGNGYARADSTGSYLWRIALPSVEVVGQEQLDAVLKNDRAALRFIRRQAQRDASHLVGSAVAGRATMLVTPEWAVPEQQLSWLFARSSQHQMLTIAGEAPALRGGKYSNRLWTGLPLKDEAGHKACLVPPPREKRYLSPHEEAALALAKVQRTAPTSSAEIYSWRGVTLASLVCFEFADIQERERLRPAADLVTVSAWNTDWRYFAAVQESTTRDNYCWTCCVNTSQFPGTLLMRPTRSALSVAAAAHGSNQPAVLIRDVDMLPVVAARAVGRRPSEITGLPTPADGIDVKQYTAVPPTFRS